MALFRNVEDTICAIATPQGFGGISVIRVSGNNSRQIVGKSCAFMPEEPESHKVYYGIFKDADKDIDEVMVSYFRKGRSFTGDETCEISCHGSPAVTKEILNILIKNGARLAERGEFTYRAFMSGRIDLIQAESILSLIQSESEKAHQMSLRQLKGGLSNTIKVLENKITYVLANLEASIDFINEGLDVLDFNKIRQELSSILEEIQKLTKSFQGSKYLNQGAKIAIVGEPNVGKSSLLNKFLGYEKALVSEIPGTTRDVVEGSLILNGIKISFNDTAGVHETNESLEKMGINKTYNEIKEADFVLYVFDMSSPPPHINGDLIDCLKNKKTIFIANKKDKSENQNISKDIENQLREIRPLFLNENDLDLVEMSAHTGLGIEKLFNKISLLMENSFTENTQTIIQSRHFELLSKIENSLSTTLQQLESGSPDIISFALREAFESFQELLGSKVDDQIMDRVFKEFCIGK